MVALISMKCLKPIQETTYVSLQRRCPKRFQTELFFIRLFVPFVWTAFRDGASIFEECPANKYFFLVQKRCPKQFQTELCFIRRVVPFVWTAFRDGASSVEGYLMRNGYFQNAKFQFSARSDGNVGSKKERKVTGKTKEFWIEL